jgi:D-alanyl-D-alanine carboxypeptidase
MKAANMIIGRKENLKREVASLTKIMTFFTVYEIMERAQMDYDSVRIKVGSLAANISGTTA